MHRCAAKKDMHSVNAYAPGIPIAEMDVRYLRVVLLPDRETVHNAFFDRSFTP